MIDNPLATLGFPKRFVERVATSGRFEDIQRLAESNLRSLSRHYHPDLTHGNADLMVEVAAAAEELRDVAAVEYYVHEFLSGFDSGLDYAKNQIREQQLRADAAFARLASSCRFTNQFEALGITHATTYLLAFGDQLLVVDVLTPSISRARLTGPTSAHHFEFRQGRWCEDRASAQIDSTGDVVLDLEQKAECASFAEEDARSALRAAESKSQEAEREARQMESVLQQVASVANADDTLVQVKMAKAAKNARMADERSLQEKKRLDTASRALTHASTRSASATRAAEKARERAAKKDGTTVKQKRWFPIPDEVAEVHLGVVGFATLPDTHAAGGMIRPGSAPLRSLDWAAHNQCWFLRNLHQGMGREGVAGEVQGLVVVRMPKSPEVASEEIGASFAVTGQILGSRELPRSDA